MKQQKWNIHTHTTRCGHATGLDIQYIQSAIEAGFTMLGFSEHLPYPEIRISGARMFYEQKDEYIATIRKLKQDYQDKIDIKVGYEVEYLKDHFNDLMNLKKECDYMILGQHFKYLIYDYDSYCSDLFGFPRSAAKNSVRGWYSAKRPRHILYIYGGLARWLY